MVRLIVEWAGTITALLISCILWEVWAVQHDPFWLQCAAGASIATAVLTIVTARTIANRARARSQEKDDPMKETMEQAAC